MRFQVTDMRTHVSSYLSHCLCHKTVQYVYQLVMALHNSPNLNQVIKPFDCNITFSKFSQKAGGQNGGQCPVIVKGTF